MAKKKDTLTYSRGIGAGVVHERVPLSIPEKHQLRVAKDTLNTPDAILGVMGGMTKAEAMKVIIRLTGKAPRIY